MGEAGVRARLPHSHPHASQISPSVAEGKNSGLTGAVQAFVAGLSLAPSEQVVAALALLLAETIETSPAYSRARLATQLRSCVDRLEEAELGEAHVPALVRGINGG
jgi:hypothetical protein